MTTEKSQPKLSGGLVAEPQLKLMCSGCNVTTLFMAESRLPKLRLKLSQSGVRLLSLQAHRQLNHLALMMVKTEKTMDFSLTSENEIDAQIKACQQVRLDEKIMAMKKAPTQHGGHAVIKNYMGDGLFFTASGTPMERIDGILHDLRWAGHGRDFARADGSMVTINVNGTRRDT